MKITEDQSQKDKDKENITFEPAAAVGGTSSIDMLHLLLIVGLVPCYPVRRLLPTFVHRGVPYAPPVTPPPAPFPWSGFLQLLLLSPTSPIPMGTTHGGCAARPTQLDGLRVRQGGVVATKSAVEANDWQEGSVVSLAKLGQAFRSEGSRHAPRTRGCQSPRPSLSIRTFRLSGAVALSYNSGPITSHQCYTPGTTGRCSRVHPGLFGAATTSCFRHFFLPPPLPSLEREGDLLAGYWPEVLLVQIHGRRREKNGLMSTTPTEIRKCMQTCFRPAISTTEPTILGTLPQFIHGIYEVWDDFFGPKRAGGQSRDQSSYSSTGHPPRKNESKERQAAVYSKIRNSGFVMLKLM